MSDRSEPAELLETTESALGEEGGRDPTWRDWAERPTLERASVEREEWADRVARLRDRGLLD